MVGLLLRVTCLSIDLHRSVQRIEERQRQRTKSTPCVDPHVGIAHEFCSLYSGANRPRMRAAISFALTGARPT